MNNTKQAYFMPGLSLGPTIFSKIVIEDYTSIYMRWMNPASEEPLEKYCTRLIELYKINNSSDTLLIGHSLGGIVIQTMAKQLDKAKVIIISSVKSRDEIPGKIRMLKYGYAYHLAGKAFIKATFNIWAGYHGYDNEELKHLLIDEVETLESGYYVWAYKQIIYWEGIQLDQDVMHIHGSADRTFPLDNIKATCVITGGDHLMVYKMADEVNAAVKSCLTHPAADN